MGARTAIWAPTLALLWALPLDASGAAGKGVVVLDPGHGGHKSGARTREGALEKDIALQIALVAKAALEERGHRVVLTRDEDRHLGLGERAALARRHEAAVYVSVHANSAPVPERRGVETYILSPDASSSDGQVALHLEEDEEETTDETFGGDKVAGDLDFILADLERSAAHQESARLARLVQDGLGGVKGLQPSRGLRQAPFKVLKDARMAAVLVEVGYLSNPNQGAYLASSRGQKAAGEALAAGIARYLAGAKPR